MPQGSNLRPLLFILYINDLKFAERYCKYHLFADDTMLCISGENLIEIKEKLEYDIKNLCNWINTNKLKINVRKTKSIILGRKKLINE